MGRDRWESDEEYEVPLTPLIDIVFILIVFFLVATTFYTEERDIEIKLAEGTQGDLITEQDEPFVINIRASGILVVNNQLVGDDELQGMLQEVAQQPNPRVEIRGDSSASHGTIMKIINLCKGEGIGDLALTQRIVKEE